MTELQLDAWARAIDEFPLLGSPADQLAALVPFAILAPSSHNAQPWRFRIEGDALALFADRGRALPVSDPDDRELLIGCGAALGHAETALRHFERRPLTALLPDPADADLLARLRVDGPYDPDALDHLLFQAIADRHTDRGPYSDHPVGDDVLAACIEAAEVEGAELHVIRDPERRETVAELVAEADRRQLADPAFRRELASWLRSNRGDAADGMPGYAHGLGEIGSLAAPLVVRTFDMGGGRAAHDRSLAAGSPVLAVLATAGDETIDRLVAGRALSRLLLRATVAGLSVSFLNQPIELPGLRPLLEGAAGVRGRAQLLVRLGYGTGGRATPRRGVQDVLGSG